MTEIPQRARVHWIGDPLTENAVLSTFSGTRMSEIVRELFMVFARRNGYEITPALVAVAEEEGRQREAAFLAEVRARGIHSGLRALLAATRKKEALRVAGELVVSPQDLVDLTYNSHRIGLSHHSKHFEFTPPARLLSSAERQTLFKAGMDYAEPDEQRVASKVRQLIVERQHRSVHMFTNSSDEWHCFFMTFKDIDGGDVNHWRQGAHLHFVNYLFNPKSLSKKKVWRALQAQDHAVPSVHIRYHDPRDRGRPASLVYIDGESGRIAKVPHG